MMPSKRPRPLKVRTPTPVNLLFKVQYFVDDKPKYLTTAVASPGLAAEFAKRKLGEHVLIGTIRKL